MHKRLSGRLTRQESIHLTLVFLGDVGPDRLTSAREAAAGAPFEPFSLSIERPGCWPHNRVAWLAPRTTPQALLALVQSLEGRLGEAGFRFEARPYAPHITVLRKARCAPLDMRLEPIAWAVRHFVLVRSRLDAAGSRYSVIGRWPEQSE